MATTVYKMLFLLIAALLPAYFLMGADVPRMLRAGLQPMGQGDGSVPTLEAVVRDRLPMAGELEQLGLDLRIMGGQREQNGIFISENGLIRNIDPPIETHVRTNTRAVREFARQLSESSSGKKSPYFAIIPTAVGVRQRELPRFALAKIEDQQRQIEEMYNMVSDVVRTVDVFYALQNHSEQYIYYRTDSSLTALGGYHVYAAIARRLDISNRSLGQFEIEYLDHAYYGDLYQPAAGTVGGWGKNTAPYRKVRPDTLLLYRYMGNREYIVSQRSGGEERIYHTLYPKQRAELGAELDVYLGGNAAVTDIRSTAPGKLRLLVFGDKTATTFLPFLCNHYQQVTFVNLYYMGAADYEEIQPEQYDQVLIAYDIESYIHFNNPAKLAGIQWAHEA